MFLRRPRRAELAACLSRLCAVSQGLGASLCWSFVTRYPGLQGSDGLELGTHNVATSLRDWLSMYGALWPTKNRNIVIALPGFCEFRYLAYLFNAEGCAFHYTSSRDRGIKHH